MLTQLTIGTLVIALSVVVQSVFFGCAESVLRRIGDWFTRRPHSPRTVLALVCMTLWLMAAHALSVGLWASTFLFLGIFDGLEPSVYFAVVAFTTLGFGDVLLSQEWRLLSGLCAANGLLIFGVSTAVLVEFLIRVRRAQHVDE